ncbi:MAG: DUF2183 domain-containing protein [Actinomycetaceae bacterium]|nr:DUF2183 domain-containing protein [Arcanobacterium sp.]MDD7687579.1 DUF2183 domain-containing protein [Actinomycetaceae bacterium]MDY5273183.1 phosphatase domain-containing protein [Arcanobacterium sp.]
MALADFARALDDAANRRGIVRRRKRGWLPHLIPYMGYGSTRAVKVMARVIMADPRDQAASPNLAFQPGTVHSLATSVVGDFAQKVVDKGAEAQRGWRQFFTTQVGFLPVTVRIGDREIHTRTDRGGYLDLLVEDHGLTPGWHDALLIPAAGAPAKAPVMIVSPYVRRGLVSDIDDTVVVTWMPRIFIAAWNAFVAHTNARQPVPGMAQMYQELLADAPNAPVFYLSSGAWNTYETILMFLQKYNFPIGPLLMTDWGPTPTGLFRNSEAHKKTQLRNLLIMFPNIKWILVGDDGQHDPIIYDDLAREHPSRVRAIALRELNPIEQVLSHGTAEPVETTRTDSDTERHGTPVVRAPDGFALVKKLRAVLHS